MDFADQINALAARIGKQLEHLKTEEATKNALIMPFINALGYNVFDPTEVVPEFTCDVGTKKGEKVDYAIMQDSKPIMLFECKQAGAQLKIEYASQLFRYFAVTEARIGVLTNGTTYLFYSDLEEPNKMDERPFLEFDMLEIREPLLIELKKLTKSAFNLTELLSAAHELKYTKALKQYLAQEWANPSAELVKFLTAQVYQGRITQAVRDQFTDIVKRSLHQFMNERINDRLKSALQQDDAQQPVLSDTLQEILTTETTLEPAEVVTTEDEMEAFRIVRAILRQSVDVSRVSQRDVKSYFGVLLDDNNRKPICRLYFNTAHKYLSIFNSDRQEQKIPISSVDDIYTYAEQLKATVASYEGNGNQA